MYSMIWRSMKELCKKTSSSNWITDPETPEFFIIQTSSNIDNYIRFYRILKKKKKILESFMRTGLIMHIKVETISKSVHFWTAFLLLLDQSWPWESFTIA